MRYRVAILAGMLLAAVCCDALAEEAPKPQHARGLRVKLLVANGCEGTRQPEPFIAGDTVKTQIRVDGLTTSSDRKLDFSFRLDLLDAQGESIRSLPWQRVNYLAGLGGDMFILGAHLILPDDLPSGRYVMSITTRDELARDVVRDELSIPVLHSGTFAATNPALTVDQAGQQPTPGTFIAGQNGFLRFQFCGFTHSAEEMHVEATLTVMDENGRPLDLDPIRIAGKSEGLQHIRDGRLAANFNFGLTRPGRFILRLAATDVLSGNTSTRDIPIRVLDLEEQPLSEAAERPVNPKR